MVVILLLMVHPHLPFLGVRSSGKARHFPVVNVPLVKLVGDAGTLVGETKGPARREPAPRLCKECLLLR